MKRIIPLVAAITLATMLFTGCAAYAVTPVFGALYTDVKAPLTATSNSEYSKVGTGEATSILGLIATGDASIQTAARNAGITKIHHVDFESKSVLGIYAKFTVYVYGE